MHQMYKMGWKENVTTRYPEIPAFTYVGSTIGNANFSGLSLSEVFSCLNLSTTVEEFDCAVSATITLTTLVKENS